MKLHQVPGYRPAYQALNRALHRHGVCVMRRSGPMEDGDYLWWCQWCGNRSVKAGAASQQRSLDRLRQAARER